MKKILFIVLLFSCFVLINCSDVEIKEDTASSSTISSVNQPTKKKSNIGGREIVLGKLIWDSGSQRYYSNFSEKSDLTSNTLLSFIGPYPIPTNVTPVFHLVGCNTPTSNTFDQSPNGEINTFEFEYTVLPSSYGQEIDESIVLIQTSPGHYELETETIEPAFPEGGESGLLRFGGKVVYINGDYYAVATSYQVNSQTPTSVGNLPSSPPPSTTPITFTKSVKGDLASSYNITVYYVDDIAVPFEGSVTFSHGKYLQFLTVVTPLSNNLPATTIRVLFPGIPQYSHTFPAGSTQSFTFGPTLNTYYSTSGTVIIK